MSKKKDLAGMRFGHLTAVEPTDQRKNGYLVWRCRCDCGREAYFSSRHLRNGWARVCGDPDCQYTGEDKKIRARYEDLTGKRFGRLVVQSIADHRTETGQVLWNCLCDCGSTVTVPSGQLNAGYRKSCGCLSRPPRKDWVGQQFGELTVLAYDEKRGGKHYWKCRCSCGNEVSVCQSSLKSGHTTSCGCRVAPYKARHIVDGTCIEMLSGAVRRGTIASNNSSGVRGVYKNRRTGNWCAQITFQGKTRYLGSYPTLREAARARQRGEEVFEDFLEEYETRKQNA